MLLSHKDDQEVVRFYKSLSDAFQIRKTARFWFGSILVMADRMDYSRLNMDLSKNEKDNLLYMLNNTLSDITSFYQKEPPEEVFRFLEVSRSLIGLGGYNSETPNFRNLMYQIHFNNSLAVFAIKNKQYSFAVDCFESILKIFEEESVDSVADIFLSAFSNYLSFLKAHQHSHLTQKANCLIKHIKNIYQNLLHRYLRVPCDENSILLMLSVSKQHERFLGKDFLAQNSLLIKKYLERGGIKQANIDQFYMKNKLAKQGTINIKKREMSFFSSAAPLLNSQDGLEKKRSSFRQTKHQLSFIHEDDRLLEMGEVGSGSGVFLNIKQKNRKSVPLRQGSIKLQSSGKFELSKGGSKFETEIQNLPKWKKSTPTPQTEKLFNKNESISLKINYVIVEVIKEGVILSDFLKEKKKFITWNNTITIMKRFRLSSSCQQYLPIYSYYDVGRLLISYVRKADAGDPTKGVSIMDIPRSLFEINILVKLLKMEGPYFKLIVMNHYDVNRIEYCIDCFLLNFKDFFKQVSNNDYIEYLNQKITRQQLTINPSKGFSLDGYRKQKEDTKYELENQLKIDKLRDHEGFRASPFRILLLMNNSQRLLVYFSEQKSEEYLELKVIELYDSKENESRLRVPIYKISRFFPIPTDVPRWIKKFGKMVVEGYMHCFQDFPSSLANQQYFSIITYAKKIEMVKSGKYLVPVSAEMVGSKNHIWGICIRYFEQAMVREEVTFLYNPYYELFSPCLKMPQPECKQVLVGQLVEGSVAKTHSSLSEIKKVNTMVCLTEYWSLFNF